jgi:alcohol dehydrogenase class IV
MAVHKMAAREAACMWTPPPNSAVLANPMSFFHAKSHVSMVPNHPTPSAPIPPFFCVPTTAGTGSEATIVTVIKDASTHEKFATNDLTLVPKIAVLDPLLMVVFLRM